LSSYNIDTTTTTTTATNTTTTTNTTTNTTTTITTTTTTTTTTNLPVLKQTRYSNPRHCWHPSGQYIYATSQTHDVLVWEVHSGKVVATMPDHTNSIKDMHYDVSTRTLASTGFDKSVKLWREIL
jgi:WD40 repeat protein